MTRESLTGALDDHNQLKEETLKHIQELSEMLVDSSGDLVDGIGKLDKTEKWASIQPCFSNLLDHIAACNLELRNIHFEITDERIKRIHIDHLRKLSDITYLLRNECLDFEEMNWRRYGAKTFITAKKLYDNMDTVFEYLLDMHNVASKLEYLLAEEKGIRTEAVAAPPPQEFHPKPSEQKKSKRRRKRGPSIDTLERCKEAMRNWLDEGQKISPASELAGVDKKTVRKWKHNVLEIVDEATRNRWIATLKALNEYEDS